jgi:hypothetical protein
MYLLLIFLVIVFVLGGLHGAGVAFLVYVAIDLLLLCLIGVIAAGMWLWNEIFPCKH